MGWGCFYFGLLLLAHGKLILPPAFYFTLSFWLIRDLQVNSDHVATSVNLITLQSQMCFPWKIANLHLCRVRMLQDKVAKAFWSAASVFAAPWFE